MKSNFYVELHGHKVEVRAIENAFKEMWKEKGAKIKDLGEVDFYYKPDEKACYYYIPETDEKGKMEF